MHKRKDKRFVKDYTKNDIVEYLKGVNRLLGEVPTFRNVNDIPGPSPRTIIRRFGKWTSALKSAGLRPQGKQLLKGERTYIKQNWKEMTDDEIASKLGVSKHVILYYRQNLKLWKNRKGTAKSTFRKHALNLYGKCCEVCGVEICEWHHIIPKSKIQTDWCILCPTCHSAITRKLVVIESRHDIASILLPYMKKIYTKLRL